MNKQDNKQDIEYAPLAKPLDGALDYNPRCILPDIDVSRDPNQQTIEVVVPGYRESNILIEIVDVILTITGKCPRETTQRIYGCDHSFSKKFTLSEFVEISDCGLCDGILWIDLKRNIPKELQPKRFLVGYNRRLD